MRPKFYLLLTALLCGLNADAEVSVAAAPVAKTLSFFHTHTGERLEVTFARRETYDRAALVRINAFLKDFRNGEEKAMDPKLMDWLYELKLELGSSGTYEVISAYRSPLTNEMLRSRSGGVAKRSQHLLGKAIDVRLDDVSVAALHQAALATQRGGLGHYPRSGFVHLDTGRVRRWKGRLP